MRLKEIGLLKLIMVVALMALSNKYFAQNVGINQDTPTNTLHITPQNAGDEPLRVEGLTLLNQGDSALLIHNPVDGVIRYIPMTTLTDSIINNITTNQTFLDSIVNIIYNYGDTLLHNEEFITNIQDSVDTHLDSLTLSGNILTGWVDGTPNDVDLSTLDGGSSISLDSIVNIIYNYGDTLLHNEDFITNLQDSIDTHLDSLTFDGTTLTGWVDGTPNDVDLSDLMDDTFLDSLTLDNNILTGWVDGTPNDVDLSELDLDYWHLEGNDGTTAPASGIGTPIDNNFIGTTDATDFALATNNFERLRIKSDNDTQIRIGVGTAFTVNLNTGSTPTLLHLHDWGTTSNDFAVLTLSTASTSQDDRTGVINFAATQSTNERRSATIESFLTEDATTNVTGDLRFFTNNNNNLGERMRITGYGNVRIGSPFAPITNPFVVDPDHIKLNVAGGYTRIGSYNSDPGVGGVDPGATFFDGVGALAVGMNRNGGKSNVDFWNVTAHGQPSADGELDRGFDWRRYDNNGDEQLVMALRGDGLLALSSNDDTMEGGQIILNNAGFSNVSENNAWSIDNYNSAGTPNAFRIFYQSNDDPSIVIPEHTTGNAQVGINFIGNVSPNYTLHANGTIGANNGYACKQGTGGAFSGNVFNIDWTGTAQLWVDNTNIGTFQFTSDRRLKKNIKSIETKALDRVMDLKPVEFKYKDVEGTIFKESNILYEGFIADELQEVIPSAVYGEKDALTVDGKIQPQTLNVFPIVSVLTKAIQEQQEIIENQQQEIEKLKQAEQSNDELKATINEQSETIEQMKHNQMIFQQQLNELMNNQNALESNK